MANDKIAVIGAGNVGAAAAQMLADRDLGDIVLLDIVKGLAQGKALDISQIGGIWPRHFRLAGTTEWERTADSKIVIVTCGLPRKAGMSRDDLLVKNVQIVREVSRNIAKYCPAAVIIVVCNPLDAMVYAAAKVTGFAREKVIGMAGALDCARFNYFLGCELGVSSEEITSVLMGGHGDDMVPLARFTSVSGIPITELLDEQKISSIIERTRKGGIEIVNLLGHSAYYAPAAGVVKMTEAILKDSKTIVPCCAYCENEYDVGGYYIGVPAILGKNGVERVLELRLTSSERTQFDKSLKHVRELAAKIEEILERIMPS
ncbi:MAG: malate dehydrogenase [Sedimentisphaerales bacterium]|nr:malate dehydrogenase [Sedimentisphaerales bacterium]